MGKMVNTASRFHLLQEVPDRELQQESSVKRKESCTPAREVVDVI